VALRKAAKKLKNYRLNDCNIYVTIEPCIMCVGALLNARIKKIIFGTFDKKSGACVSVFKIADNEKFNHKIEIIGGKKEHLNTACLYIIQTFFKNKRLYKSKIRKTKKTLS
jgi:tRNA(adenine34) deaminase